MTRREKEQSLNELEDKFRRAQSAILADFQGLSVAEITRFRKMAREAGVEFEVVKNTLAGIATRRVGIEGLDKLLVGPTGVAFGYHDPVAPARVIYQFGKGQKVELPFKGGWLPGRVLNVEDVKKLAMLPGRQELLGRVAGGMQAPIGGFCRVLAGNLRGLVVVLSRVGEKKAAEAAS